MNMFDSIIFSVIIIIFPILCYLFYIVTDKNINIKRKDLILVFTILSIYYLLFKNFKTVTYYYLLITIPILLSIEKKYYKLYIFLIINSIVILFYQNNLYLLFFVIEQLLILVLNRINRIYSIIVISIINLIYFIIFSNADTYLNIIYILLYVVIVLLSRYTIIMGENVINYNIEYKDLKKENELRRSLFKITHEIKNPLAVIKAYTDIFDCNDMELCKKYIPIISGEIDKMLLLLQDFLLVNKDNIIFDIMDINMLIDDVNKTLKEINHFNINIDTNYDEELLIKGDYNRLSQVLINIIKNSYEAHADKVLVKSYIDEDNVIMEISDNGDGIKDIDKIYEPFYTTKVDGTGLGVPLSKEIIEAHNGSINYYNNIIKGTMVRISIPLLDM